MSKNQLKEQSLLHLLSQNNFIIPEIQREYVWGQNEEVLSRFLDSIIEKIGESCDQCGNPKKNTKINVGFLYTYKPSYVTYSAERFLDENIIDGQQRFTTLFLMLFYCAIKENRIDDFKEVVRLEEDLEMAFDYKVRNLTHIFLFQLVKNISKVEDLNLIFNGNATWFLSDFKKDVTINSIIKALQIIDKKFSSKKNIYFDYILNNIKFYHFRTEATNQGEELYITMNARGEALSKNEENKAALMLDDTSLIEFGTKWEYWQDFFWKNRDKNNPKSNADVGFNEFLRWIQIIEMTLSDAEIDANEDEKIAEESLTKEIISLIQGEKVALKKEYFSIIKIEKYFESVRYLFEDYLLNEDYYFKYSTDLKFKILKPQYLHPQKRKIEQAESFVLLPVIYYVYKLQLLGEEVKNQNIFRLLRFLTNLRKDITITKTINKQVINAIKLVDVLVEQSDDIAEIINIQDRRISKTLITPEEEFKFKIYSDSSNREEIESKFWRSENNKILKGKIAPLLQYSFISNEDKKDFVFEKTFEKFDSTLFNLQHFNFVYINFLKLTSESETSISNNIWGSLLLTDYFEVKDYNDNHKLVSCLNSDDFHLIRSKFFLNKIDEVNNYSSSKDYFEDIFSDFITKYSSLGELTKEIDYKNQLYAYYIALVNSNKWNFGKGKNFGVYIYPKKFNSFFENNVKFQHYRLKWAGADYNYFDDNKSTMNNFYKKIV